ncbi:MAG: hypothetical protein NVSMB9_02660 [Isosphaeraceae bacterium]
MKKLLSCREILDSHRDLSLVRLDQWEESRRKRGEFLSLPWARRCQHDRAEGGRDPRKKICETHSEYAESIE